jgi:hypothetical protein
MLFQKMKKCSKQYTIQSALFDTRAIKVPSSFQQFKIVGILLYWPGGKEEGMNWNG